MEKPSRVLDYFYAPVLAVPVTILLHELGHLFAARFFRFEDVRLHPFYTDYVVHDYPNHERLIVTTAGIVMTTLTAIVAAHMVQRTRHPSWIGILLAAPLRGWYWVPGSIVMLRGLGQPKGGDEFEMATRSGLPIQLFIVFNLGLCLASVALTHRALRTLGRSRLLVHWVALILGILVGVFAYANLAPLVLSQ